MTSHTISTRRPIQRLATRIASVLALTALLVPASVPAVTAGPTPGGIASDNVEWVKSVPFEFGTAIGARVIGKHLFVTSWKSFSIYDISDPMNPVLTTPTPIPIGFQFENEDVDTNGKIMLFSETTPLSRLHVWDVEDKTNPVEIATLSGAGQHTTSCIFKCKYGLGSGGNLVDLRNPSKPKLLGNYLKAAPTKSTHDVTEVSPGVVLTSSRPVMLLDFRKNLLKPAVLAVGDDKNITGGVHSNQWPRMGKDKFFLLTSESNFTGRCSGKNGAFMTWDASRYKKTKSFKMIDVYQFENGTWTDGNPGATGSGCSAHWFQEHPKFRNGGMVAMGAYDHGTRFINVTSKGQIQEKGYYVPYGGQTSAAYWVTKDVVYGIDVTRGIDILRYKDKI